MNKIFQTKNIISFTLVVVTLFGHNLISEKSESYFSHEVEKDYSCFSAENQIDDERYQSKQEF